MLMLNHGTTKFLVNSSGVDVKETNFVDFRKKYGFKQICQKPKIPNLVYFGGRWNGKCWFILCSFGIYQGYLVELWPFGIFCRYLVYSYHFGILNKEKSGNPGFKSLIGDYKQDLCG
jgi:hypothetical protein